MKNGMGKGGGRGGAGRRERNIVSKYNNNVDIKMNQENWNRWEKCNVQRKTISWLDSGSWTLTEEEEEEEEEELLEEEGPFGCCGGGILGG